MKIKPCPFCGVTPDIDLDSTFMARDGGKYGAVNCCCEGPSVRTNYAPVFEWRDRAIAEWNKRSGE